jgi:hypothetical protein
VAEGDRWVDGMLHRLAWLPLDVVHEQLARGRLLSARDEWAITFAGYHAYDVSRPVSPALFTWDSVSRSPFC